MEGCYLQGILKKKVSQVNPRKQMACIGQLSSSCLKKFMTTPECRICTPCSKIIHDMQYGEGRGKAMADILEKQAH
jgi:hypothetical protein